MTTDEVKRLHERACDCYTRHKRHREYAVDGRSRRQLAALLAAAREVHGKDGDAVKIFHNVLEKLSDEYGANLLRPKPREPKSIPEPWKDAHGNVMGNPLLDLDKSRRERGRTVLFKHDPELLAYYEKAADDPYGTEQARRQEARECEEENKLEAAYSETTHEHNPFAASASASARSAFVKEHPEKVAIYRREAKPVRSNAFGSEANETVRTQIVKSDPDLWRIVKIAELRNAELIGLEREEARRQAEAARQRIIELEPIAALKQAPTHSLDSTPAERAKSPMPFA